MTTVLLTGASGYIGKHITLQLLNQGYIVLVLLLLMNLGPEVKLFQPEGNDGSYLIISMMFLFAALPSMILAWRERDI
jgi:nucleoside-diphosphate-sugar epimerase